MRVLIAEDDLLLGATLARLAASTSGRNVDTEGNSLKLKVQFVTCAASSRGHILTVPGRLPAGLGPGAMSATKRRPALFGLRTMVGAAVALGALYRSGHKVDGLLDAQMAETAYPARYHPGQTLARDGHPLRTSESRQAGAITAPCSLRGAAASLPDQRCGFSFRCGSMGGITLMLGLPGRRGMAITGNSPVSASRKATKSAAWRSVRSLFN